MLVKIISLLFCSNVIFGQECGQREPSSAARKQNYEANAKDWPWHVAVLQHKNDSNLELYECGGILIDKARVLTAAQCVFDKNKKQLTEKEIFVDLGRYKWSSHQQVRRFRVSKIHVNENYTNVHGPNNDIAILYLEDKVNYTMYIRPVCLPEDFNVDNVSGAMLVGWNVQNDDLAFGKLKEGYVPVLSIFDCLEQDPDVLSKFMKRGMMCSGYKTGMKTCNMGRGNGLYVQREQKWYAIGISSYSVLKPNEQGVICDHSLALSTDLFDYKKWVDDSYNQFGSDVNTDSDIDVDDIRVSN